MQIDNISSVKNHIISAHSTDEMCPPTFVDMLTTIRSALGNARSTNKGVFQLRNSKCSLDDDEDAINRFNGVMDALPLGKMDPALLSTQVESWDLLCSNTHTLLAIWEEFVPAGQMRRKSTVRRIVPQKAVKKRERSEEEEQEDQESNENEDSSKHNSDQPVTQPTEPVESPAPATEDVDTGKKNKDQKKKDGTKKGGNSKNKKKKEEEDKGSQPKSEEGRRRYPQRDRSASSGK